MDLGMKKSTKAFYAGVMATVWAAVLLIVFIGCKGEESLVNTETSAAVRGKSAEVATTAAERPKPKGNPQPKLPVLKLWVGTNQISAEIASTLDQIRSGMMFRTNMAEMEGMLFVFPQPQQVAFYMRNTLLPLSCAYIDSEGTILEVYDMEPLNEDPIVSKSIRIQYVLEMNQGWFQRHHVGPGMVMSTERGTFPQTFQRR
jgi:uncharacterized membrane protein (UPF0127 family)